eukprot:10280474-Lingulodinium_polyedra.AAC.1
MHSQGPPNERIDEPRGSFTEFTQRAPRDRIDMIVSKGRRFFRLRYNGIFSGPESAPLTS